MKEETNINSIPGWSTLFLKISKVVLEVPGVVKSLGMSLLAKKTSPHYPTSIFSLVQLNPAEKASTHKRLLNKQRLPSFSRAHTELREQTQTQRVDKTKWCKSVGFMLSYWKTNITHSLRNKSQGEWANQSTFRFSCLPGKSYICQHWLTGAGCYLERKSCYTHQGFCSSYENIPYRTAASAQLGS